MFDFLSKLFDGIVKTAFHMCVGYFWEFFLKKNIVFIIFGHRTKNFEFLSRNFRRVSQNCNLRDRKRILRKTFLFLRKLFVFHHFWTMIKAFSTFCQIISGWVDKAALYVHLESFPVKKNSKKEFFSDQFWTLRKKIRFLTKSFSVIFKTTFFFSREWIWDR